MSATDEFLQRCRHALPQGAPPVRCVVRRMGNAPAIGETLLGLVGSGQKTGLFSLPKDLQAVGGIPRPGDYVLFIDHSDRPRCLVQIEECRQLAFNEVGPDLTACESPAAHDVEVWRGIHRRYWTTALAARGERFDESQPVVFQRFRLVHYEA